MKWTPPNISTLQRILLQWLGVVFAFSAVVAAVVTIALLGVRFSPVFLGVDPPSSTVITAVPQELRLSEYTIIQELHGLKGKQRMLLEGFSAHPFDPLTSLDAD